MNPRFSSIRWIAVGALLLNLGGPNLRAASTTEPPTQSAPALVVTVTRSPAIEPGPQGLGEIAGKVTGVSSEEVKVVIYALGDRWYVQPWANAPDTRIRRDGTWETRTHGGYQYAVLVVKPSFKALATLTQLPEVGGEVLAIEKTKPHR